MKKRNLITGKPKTAIKIQIPNGLPPKGSTYIPSKVILAPINTRHNGNCEKNLGLSLTIYGQITYVGLNTFSSLTAKRRDYSQLKTIYNI